MQNFGECIYNPCIWIIGYDLQRFIDNSMRPVGMDVSFHNNPKIPPTAIGNMIKTLTGEHKTAIYNSVTPSAMPKKICNKMECLNRAELQGSIDYNTTTLLPSLLWCSSSLHRKVSPVWSWSPLAFLHWRSLPNTVVCVAFAQTLHLMPRFWSSRFLSSRNSKGACWGVIDVSVGVFPAPSSELSESSAESSSKLWFDYREPPVIMFRFSPASSSCEVSRITRSCG